jgi:hypothetical protein
LEKDKDMNKSWSLYKWKPYKDYPSVNYFWVNPDGIIKYTRSVEPWGYLAGVDLSDMVDCYFDEAKKHIEKTNGTNSKVTKAKVRKMTEEQLSKGMLFL